MRKLATEGVDAGIARQALDELAEASLQSDERFAEVFVRSRQRRGQGPLRLSQELRARGIPGSQVDAALAGQDWDQALTEVHSRKFGNAKPTTPKEYAARVRFLRQRGFGQAAIQSLLRRLGSDDEFPCTDE